MEWNQVLERDIDRMGERPDEIGTETLPKDPSVFYARVGAAFFTELQALQVSGRKRNIQPTLYRNIS